MLPSVVESIPIIDQLVSEIEIIKENSGMKLNCLIYFHWNSIYNKSTVGIKLNKLHVRCEF